MALITCTECGKQLSDKAASCPYCGCPMSVILESMAFHDFQDRSSIISEIDTNKNDDRSNEADYEQVNPTRSVSDDDLVHCPKCGSTQITGKKKGFGLGKAVLGGLLLGPFGLLGGAIGSNETLVVCLKCGNEWKV